MVGGMARIAHLIRSAKKNHKNVLAVDAGDIFQGTAFFENYKGETDVECLNKAGYDIYTIGNHEFDDGPENLGKQLKLAKFDVINCNLDVSSEPNLREVVKPSVVKEIDGEKVGFVGVITPALKEVAPKLGDVKVSAPGANWMDPVRAEIDKLKKQGINKIVVVSHCGVDMERFLGGLDDVDIVIGGHSHTRLDKAIMIDHPDGSTAMVVQTGCYGRALGRLDLVFDKSGKLVFPDSKYHLTNITDKIFEEPDIKAYVTEKGKPFQYLFTTILGTAEANFDSRGKIYPTDSSLGDLVCDALFDAASEYGATITMQNRGGIRAGIDQGQINLEKVREVLPFENKLVVGTVTGSVLLKALENAVSTVGLSGNGGRFLDVHGLKFGWDPTLEVGHRIVFAFAQNKEGNYEAVAADEPYRIAMNDFSFNGGEGYDFSSAKDVVRTDLKLSTIMENYLKKKKSVAPALPSRFLRVSSNIAKKNGDEINVDYPAPDSELTIISGTGKGVSFLAKIGTLPVVNPKIIRTEKTDDGGRLSIKIKDLLGSKADGDNPLWLALVLSAKDKDSNSVKKIVSVPIQIR